MMKHEDEAQAAVSALIEGYFGCLRRPVRKNLTRLTGAFLRLLMGFTLAYLMVLLLGQDPLAQRLCPLFEQPRHLPCHGTKKVLSVLSIALYLLSDPRWGQNLRKRWT